MGLPGVDLDDEPGLCPHEVRPSAPTANLRSGARDVEATAQPEERILQLGLRGVEVVEELAEGDAGATGQRVLDRLHAEQAAELRFSHDSLEGLVIEGVGEVDEGSGRRRHRDAHPLHPIGGCETPLMRDDAANPPVVRDRHLRHPPATAVPERAGTRVTQDRAGAAREHGCEPAGLVARCAVAEGVHAPVKPQEPAAGDRSLDPAPIEAEGGQLSARHDAVLPTRQLCEIRGR